MKLLKELLELVKYKYGLKIVLKTQILIIKRQNKLPVYTYNNLRTHFRIDLRKPVEVHLNSDI